MPTAKKIDPWDRLRSRMEKQERNSDTEGAHVEADRILCSALRLAVSQKPSSADVSALLRSYRLVDKWFS